MGELLVMMMTMISPSGREVPPAESLHQRAKVLLPMFLLETVALHTENIILVFSRSKPLIYQKMGPGGVPGRPQPTRALQGAWRAQVGCAHLVAPLWCLLTPIFLK